MSTEMPLYRRIKDGIKQHIEDGTLGPGSRAPSERELAARYGVSRMTARQALSELAQEGLLERIQGQGTFVAEKKIEQSVSELIGFSEDMRRRRLESHTQVLAVERGFPSLDLSTQLGIGLGEPTVSIERLRFAAGRTMSHEISVLPAHLLEGIEKQDLSGSLYALLRDVYGIHLTRADQRIEGLRADERQASILDVQPGAVLLRLERVSYAGDLPIEHVDAYYRADRYAFTASLEARK